MAFSAQLKFIVSRAFNIGLNDFNLFKSSFSSLYISSYNFSKSFAVYFCSNCFKLLTINLLCQFKGTLLSLKSSLSKSFNV